MKIPYLSVNNLERFEKAVSKIEDQVIIDALVDRIKVYLHTLDHREDYKRFQNKDKSRIKRWRDKQKKKDTLDGEIPQSIKLAPTKEPIKQLLKDTTSLTAREIKEIIDSI